MGWQACVSAERSCCGLKDNHFPLNHDYGGKSKITMNIKCQHLSNPHFCLLLTQRTSPPTSSNSGHLLWVNSLVTWSRWLVCVMNGNKLNEILATWLITQGWGRLQFLQVSNEKGDPGSLLERWGDENLLNYMSIISFQPWNKDSVIETNQDSMESNGPRFFFLRWLKWEVEWSVETPGGFSGWSFMFPPMKRNGFPTFAKWFLVGGHVNFRGCNGFEIMKGV